MGGVVCGSEVGREEGQLVGCQLVRQCGHRCKLYAHV